MRTKKPRGEGRAKKSRSKKSRYCLALAAALLGATLPFPAAAGVLTINSPDVDEGELAFEAGIALERNGDRTKDYFREHALEFSYSPTGYWSTGLEFVMERESGHGLRHTAVTWKNTVRFIEQKDGVPFSMGMRLQYEKARLDADEFSARLLLRHRAEDWEARFNIGGDREIGAGREGGVQGDVRASLRYRWTEALTPALDYLGDTGSLHRLQGFSEQDHRFGPVLYGRLSSQAGFEAGYLAGISGGAPDHSVKFSVEYTF